MFKNEMLSSHQPIPNKLAQHKRLFSAVQAQWSLKFSLSNNFTLSKTKVQE